MLNLSGFAPLVSLVLTFSRCFGIQRSTRFKSIELLSVRCPFLRFWARATALLDHHQTVLTGGSAKASSPQEMVPERGRLSEAVDDLCRILFAIPGAETEPSAMEPLEDLLEVLI